MQNMHGTPAHRIDEIQPFFSGTFEAIILKPLVLKIQLNLSEYSPNCNSRQANPINSAKRLFGMLVNNIEELCGHWICSKKSGNYYDPIRTYQYLNM